MAAIQTDAARGSQHSFQCLSENSPSLLQSRHCLAFEQENLSNAVDTEKGIALKHSLQQSGL